MTVMSSIVESPKAHGASQPTQRRSSVRRERRRQVVSQQRSGGEASASIGNTDGGASGAERSSAGQPAPFKRTPKKGRNGRKRGSESSSKARKKSKCSVQDKRSGSGLSPKVSPVPTDLPMSQRVFPGRTFFDEIDRRIAAEIGVSADAEEVRRVERARYDLTRQIYQLDEAQRQVFCTSNFRAPDADWCAALSDWAAKAWSRFVADSQEEEARRMKKAKGRPIRRDFMRLPWPYETKPLALIAAHEHGPASMADRLTFGFCPGLDAPFWLPVEQRRAAGFLLFMDHDLSALPGMERDGEEKMTVNRRAIHQPVSSLLVRSQPKQAQVTSLVLLRQALRGVGLGQVSVADSVDALVHHRPASEADTPEALSTTLAWHSLRKGGEVPESFADVDELRGWFEGLLSDILTALAELDDDDPRALIRLVRRQIGYRLLITTPRYSDDPFELIDEIARDYPFARQANDWSRRWEFIDGFRSGELLPGESNEINEEK